MPSGQHPAGGAALGSLDEHDAGDDNSSLASSSSSVGGGRVGGDENALGMAAAARAGGAAVVSRARTAFGEAADAPVEGAPRRDSGGAPAGLYGVRDPVHAANTFSILHDEE
jgi:hypothetical protein